MPSEKRQFGNIGEDEAIRFLLEKNYKILDRNYRVKNIGEIDVVCENNNKLVFFEVKTRNAIYESKFPIQLSINYKKRKNLKRICEIYLLSNKNYKDREWQVDGIFINVDLKSDDKYRIEHIENILWEEYY